MSFMIYKEQYELLQLLLRKSRLHILVGLGLISLSSLTNLFLTNKRHPSNAQFSYTPNSSLFQATVYPVSVSKVRSLYMPINVCISVKLCFVVTKIGTTEFACIHPARVPNFSRIRERAC